MSKLPLLRIWNKNLLASIIVGSAVITFYTACGGAMAQGEDERRRDAFNLAVMNQFQESSMDQATFEKLHLQDFVAHEVEGYKIISTDKQPNEFEVDPINEVGGLLAKINFEKLMKASPKELVLGPNGLEGAQAITVEVIVDE